MKNPTMSLVADTADVELWESGELGRDEEFVRKAQTSDDSLDEKLGLQMISIRLQKSLIEDLKDIAEKNPKRNGYRTKKYRFSHEKRSHVKHIVVCLYRD